MRKAQSEPLNTSLLCTLVATLAPRQVQLGFLGLDTMCHLGLPWSSCLKALSWAKETTCGGSICRWERNPYLKVLPVAQRAWLFDGDLANPERRCAVLARRRHDGTASLR